MSDSQAKRKELADKLAQKKAAAEQEQAEANANMEKCTQEIYDLVCWFAKNKYCAQHSTIL